jgi:hypothetical protein
VISELNATTTICCGREGNIALFFFVTKIEVLLEFVFIDFVTFIMLRKSSSSSKQVPYSDRLPETSLRKRNERDQQKISSCHPILGTREKIINIASVYVHQDCSSVDFLFKTVITEQLACFGTFNCRGYFNSSETDNQNGLVLDSLLLEQQAGCVQVVLRSEPALVKVESSTVYGAILDIGLIPSPSLKSSRKWTVTTSHCWFLSTPHSIFSGKNKQSQLKLQRNALTERNGLLSPNRFVHQSLPCPEELDLVTWQLLEGIKRITVISTRELYRGERYLSPSPFWNGQVTKLKCLENQARRLKLWPDQ